MFIFKRRHHKPRLTLAWSLSMLFSLTAQAAPQAGTSSGIVQGNTAEGVKQFLGIPYAAPPIGPLRWKAPQAPATWQGVRQATAVGPACPQLLGDYSRTATQASHEDCLNLNVYVPEAPRTTPRPVLVWLHPGSLTMGSGSDFDGKALARGADAVVVTINYRLGALGFLSTTELQQEAPAGNYALQDQQQALRWVQANIGAFGGDARRVTLAGNSAGAASGCAQLLSPPSAGLFHRVIMQSGPCVRLGNKTLEQARTQGDEFAAKVNCPIGVGQLACLRSRSASELVAAAGDGLDALQSANPWLPVIDGVTIPRNMTDMIRDGDLHKVPVLMGTTAQEGRFFVAYAFHQKRGRTMTADDYKSAAEIMTGNAFSGSTSRSLYTASNYGSNDLAMSALMTDAGFACPMLTDAKRMSRHTQVHVYEFTDTRAPAPPDAYSFDWQAYHTSELPYLFGAPVFATNLSGPLSAEQHALADNIVRYWAAFAANGDPNQSGLPKWNKFNELGMPIMNLAPGQVGLQGWGAFGMAHRCLTWSLLFSLSGQ
jgi:para-nitrobenzyl esterase